MGANPKCHQTKPQDNTGGRLVETIHHHRCSFLVYSDCSVGLIYNLHVY